MTRSLTSVASKERRLGANRLPDGSWEFLVWAPNARGVSVHIPGEAGTYLEMEPLPHGYHRGIAYELSPGSQYFFRLDGERELPDPASRFQPEGVHGPSELVDLSAFPWTDDQWSGRPLETSIFYELHVGTYTQEGTFEALISRLPDLVDLGVTTIELMPVAQFPGARNWGYDGAYLFAAQNSYGGPGWLQRLVDAAHQQGLSVALDVVYNHLGPEGNYLSAYGPYFTDRYRTPWGEALNFDGAGSDEVRRFFIENALYWIQDYHVDALRLDAVHGIFDFSARHFLAELKASVDALSQRLGRRVHLIAESDLNDSRLLRGPEHDGFGLDAQWSDDFHHSVHSLLTGERLGYYSDFEGVAPLAASIRDGWYFAGQYSHYRGRRHGNSPAGISSSHFVVCTQNHDQVGNRAAGERLSSLVDFESAKLAAGITLLSPFVPLLFMGEEYGETAPFQYFTSHGDPALVEAVRRGRRDEFAAFGWQDTVPDPQAEQTFARSRLNPSLKDQEPHRTLFLFYRELIRIREEYGLGFPAQLNVYEVGDRALVMLRDGRDEQLAMLFNFAETPVVMDIPRSDGTWKPVIHSADARWHGKDSLPAQLSLSPRLRLSPRSFLVAARTQAHPEAQ